MAWKNRRELTAFGTAAWATLSDVERAGMFQANQGLILGRMPDDSRSLCGAIKALLNPRIDSPAACTEFMEALNQSKRKEGRLVRLPQAVHTAVFAPTGVGKGVSCIIPFLMGCLENCVVLDFKGELARLTAAHRRAMGHKVVILDPYKIVTDKPDTYNALDDISPTSITALDACRDIAEALVVRSNSGDEKDPHWNDTAESLIGGLAATVVYCDRRDLGMRSLQTVSDFLSSPELMEMSKKKMQDLGGLLARWGGQLDHIKGEEKNSVFSTANRHLRFLNTPAIMESTSSSSFDPSMLKKGKMTVYLVLPPDRMRAQAGLLRLWIGSMFRAIIQCGLDETKRVHFILDEAAVLNSMQQIDDAIDKYRGYGIRLQLYYQSLGQLKISFPRDQGQTLLSNTSKIFFGVNDVETALFISRSLGNKTIVVDGWSSNNGWQRNQGTSKGRDYSESTGTTQSGGSGSDQKQTTRELLKPEEVMSLNQRICIILTPGLPPLKTRLLRYFEEPQLFTPRDWWHRVKTACWIFAISAALLILALVNAASMTGCLKIAIEKANAQPTSRPINVSPRIFYEQRRP
jgi:type IV secretion system protein VirD4